MEPPVREPPVTNISLTKHPPKPPATKDKPAVTPRSLAEGDGDGGIPGGASATNILRVLGSLDTTGAVTFTGMIESVFITRFRAKFGVPPVVPRPWPTNDALRDKKKMAAEFNDAFSALFLLQEAFQAPPTDGTPGSSKKLIEELIRDTGWPTDDVRMPIPPPWNTPENRDQYRRYEIACAIQTLMKAYDAAGAGGGSTPFPPDH